MEREENIRPTVHSLATHEDKQMEDVTKAHERNNESREVSARADEETREAQGNLATILTEFSWAGRQAFQSPAPRNKRAVRMQRT